MAYNEKLADRVREKLVVHKKVEEKKMMGGLCFMYKSKMCCGIVKDDLMVRVIASRYNEALSHPYGREMDFTGRPLKGFVFVAPDGFIKEKDLSYWIQMGVEFVDALSPQKKSIKKKLPKQTAIRKKSLASNKSQKK